MENATPKGLVARTKTSRFAKKAEVTSGENTVTGNTSADGVALRSTTHPQTEVSSPRQSMRPDLREESPLERAKRRVAELKGHVGGSLDEGVDKFFIPLEIIPEGWTYEWKRKLLVGQEDPSYQVNLARQGWEPVPASRHRSMMPEGHYNTIERDGMILMERPKEITDEYRAMERRKAALQVRQKEQQLAGAPEGQFGRDDPRVQPKIKKNFEPIPIDE